MTTTTDPTIAALQVLAWTRATRDWLRAHDPKALEQADAALAAAGVETPEIVASWDQVAAGPQDPRPIQVGDYVRSFDFPDRSRDLEGPDACYAEGLVTSVKGDRLVVDVIWQVWEGREQLTAGYQASPPQNGLTMIPSGRLTDGVEVLEGLDRVAARNRGNLTERIEAMARVSDLEAKLAG